MTYTYIYQASFIIYHTVVIKPSRHTIYYIIYPMTLKYTNSSKNFSEQCMFIFTKFRSVRFRYVYDLKLAIKVINCNSPTTKQRNTISSKEKKFITPSTWRSSYIIIILTRTHARNKRKSGLSAGAFSSYRP